MIAIIDLMMNQTTEAEISLIEKINTQSIQMLNQTILYFKRFECSLRNYCS